MIIEYKNTARFREFKGNNFTAYFYYRKRNTNIIYELWEAIQQVPNISNVETMHQYLMAQYILAKSKSRCQIYKSDGYINITNKGVFPNILIQFENV